MRCVPRRSACVVARRCGPESPETSWENPRAQWVKISQTKPIGYHMKIYEIWIPYKPYDQINQLVISYGIISNMTIWIDMDQSRPEKPDPYSKMIILVLPPKASLLVSVLAATAPHPCGFWAQSHCRAMANTVDGFEILHQGNYW